MEADWYTESFAEAAQVLLSPETFSSADVLKARPSHKGLAGKLLAEQGLPYARTLIDNDAPEHKRFRQLIAPFFSNARVKSLREPARNFVRTAIDEVRPHGAMELVSKIASPLPLAMIGAVLGMSMSSGSLCQVKAWCDDWMALQSSSAPEGELVRCAQSYLSLQRFMSETLQNHDAAADDLLGALVRARSEGMLSRVEQVRLAMGVLVAGHETTTLGIANAAVAFVEYPQYHAAVRAEASARRAFVEEALRLDPPVQLLFRRVDRDTAIGGVTVAAGDRVAIDYACANRDAAQMGSDAQRFLPGPASRKAHLGFGRGEHACPGSTLARLEIELVLEALSGLPGLRFSEPPRRRAPHASLGGWDRIPLEWDASP